MVRRWLRDLFAPPSPPTTPEPRSAPPPVREPTPQPGPAPHPAPPQERPIAPPRRSGGIDAENRVRALLASDHVSPATRAVMTRRLDALHEPPIERGVVLSPGEIVTLRAMLGRLVPQDDRELPVDLVAAFDRQLATGRGKGWRLETMPPDREAMRLGLAGLDQSARIWFAQDFHELGPRRQDDVLRKVQTGTARGDAWAIVPSDLWFSDVVEFAARAYYADPLSMDEIDFVGYADVPGWRRVGLNEADPRDAVTPVDIPGHAAAGTAATTSHPSSAGEDT